ncbi:ATP synthase [Aureimonas ureilytica]|uniref:ATP synthase n=1 Tax=Aureimonas ureilytica TaxID=401562 RepID=A0A175RJN1_9HYPH|nr:L,D-transpeptidase [Aureimonas ureilytica]KTR03836.1 ATP synthase [Aureimonas ureilytica]
MVKTRLWVAAALALAGLCASHAPANAQQGYGAQYEDYGPGTESFVDENGNIVTVDSYGRVIAVERPRSVERRRDRAPPGVEYQVPRGNGLQADPYAGNGNEYARAEDPYARGGNNGWNDGPVEFAPLPAPGTDGYAPPDQSINGSLAPDGSGYGNVPPGSGLGHEGSTMIERHPAPKVVGPKGKNAKAEIAALQVLLSRAGISPGVIDGRLGSNVDKAVAAYTEKTGRTIDATDARALMEELMETGGPAVTSYTITNEDVAGPYLASIPEDYAHKAALPAMSYTRVTEMLGERFHMDEDYLKEINPGADFNRPGTIIKVMAVGPGVTGEVTRIIADKGREQVRAYDASGHLVAAYPSSIGSTSTPSPSGTVEVKRIAFNPNYTYNPKINFKQGNNDKILTIPPGPNGPVGTIWIALSKPTYGIHGTPEPSKIGKTNSHGCVRLTNWDATELAKMVKPGTVVEFID